MGLTREKKGGEREHERMWEFGGYDLFTQFYWMNEEKWRRLKFQIVIRVTVLNPIQPISNDHQLKGQWPQHFFFSYDIQFSFDRINESNPTIEVLLIWFYPELTQCMYIYYTTHENKICSKSILDQSILPLHTAFMLNTYDTWS